MESLENLTASSKSPSVLPMSQTRQLVGRLGGVLAVGFADLVAQDQAAFRSTGRSWRETPAPLSR